MFQQSCFKALDALIVVLHGGMGITDELVIGHALKRIRVLALTFGDGAAALDDYRRAA